MPLIAEPLEGVGDPASVFAMIAARSAQVFWLDAGPEATSGWSWVGCGIVEEKTDAVRDVDCADPAAPDHTPWPAGPFRGGWVGWLGYERGAELAGAPVAGTEGEPIGERWLRVDEFVSFDHGTGRAWAIAPPERIDAFQTSLVSDPDRPDALPVTVPASTAVVAHTSAAVASTAVVAHTSAAEYASLIARCRDHIREGDAYQLCLTTRFSTPASVDPVLAHERLRAMTPAHHGGIVRSGDVALISASPEQFLTVTGGQVRTKPIKGTRPRAADPQADAALARELRESEKERAENVMIVDLMRNDLSRVCEPGTVAVDALLDVESYPAVHQLVSTVSGRLSPHTTVGALLDAAFPAGSMTGAPKLSAMEILHELESGPRGIFAGCYGWVGTDGALDLAMVIRSIVTHPGGAYVGAGGGITWRSDAAAEVAEVAIKARGPLAAIGADLPPGW